MQLEVAFTGGLCVDGMMQLDSCRFLLCNRKPVILVTERSKQYANLGNMKHDVALVCQQVWCAGLTLKPGI